MFLFDRRGAYVSRISGGFWRGAVLAQLWNPRGRAKGKSGIPVEFFLFPEEKEPKRSAIRGGMAAGREGEQHGPRLNSFSLVKRKNQREKRQGWYGRNE